MARVARSADRCTAAISQAFTNGNINRSVCDYLVQNFALTHEIELDALLGAVRAGEVTVNERR